MYVSEIYSYSSRYGLYTIFANGMPADGVGVIESFMKQVGGANEDVMDYNMLNSFVTTITGTISKLYGAAVDINPYEDGNPYGSEGPYSKSEWEALPENHLKYQIIYKDSPMVQIAQAYTLNWGGSWTHGTYDIMHFSFVCDGKTRAEWQQSSGT